MKTEIKTEFKTWWVNYLLAPFSWSRWTDIITFSYAGAYLLQGKVNRLTNAKKFKITALRANHLGVAKVERMPIETLEKCGLIDQQVKYNYSPLLNGATATAP
jgi:hypothetical protein